MQPYSKSKDLAERAFKVVPGGVHSPLRRTEPLIIWDKAKSSRIYDVDGNEYIACMHAILLLLYAGKKM